MRHVFESEIGQCKFCEYECMMLNVSSRLSVLQKGEGQT